jgi:hypothetical protein
MSGSPYGCGVGRRWTSAFGWQELRREIFAVEGRPALSGRWVALADVPDHDLMPDMLPGRPAVTFRAGTDIALQTLGLWLLSWPVRWLRIGAPARLAFLVPPLQRLTTALGSDRSAMCVMLTGSAGGRDFERRWTLIAEGGDGPEIPTLAAVLLADAVLAGRIPPGAHDAARLLDLDTFEPLLASLSVRHETVEKSVPPPLYERVMGARFAALPDAVREMHRVQADAGASGEAEVVRGRNIAARLVAWAMRFPPAGRHAAHVAFTERDGVETWTREFGRYCFTSQLRMHRSQLVERFGPLRFRFELPSDGEGLAMRMVGWSCFGIPLPMALAPQGTAREWQEDGRFRFDVPIALPVVGLVVHYTGWLIRDT